ncbi:MAG: hypothetical protein NTV48_01790, partial [Candidatus Vogelbacteria bacterium]|nr:hypothetical protein [Candidatus Vogelbacteria bacterium]
KLLKFKEKLFDSRPRLKQFSRSSPQTKIAPPIAELIFVLVENDDFYWNSLEHYVIEWYPAVEEENKRLNR